MKHQLRLTAAAAVVALLGACASTPTQPNAALEEARRLYGSASNDPLVVQNAAVELDRARQTLNRADEAWTDDQDAAETNHLAYLAKQLTVVARETAAQRGAEAQVRQASAERERIRAQAHAADARAAQSQAATAEARAAAAQAEARAAQERAAAAREQAQDEATRAQELEQELQQLQARDTDRGMVITLQDVLFDVGEATLKPGAERTLDRVADLLKEHPERRLLIEGYTDATGSESYNLDLSRRRAEAVERALVREGVPGERIEIQPHGEAYPVADNDTAAGRQMNRRVELLFSDEQGQIEPR